MGHIVAAVAVTAGAVVLIAWSRAVFKKPSRPIFTAIKAVGGGLVAAVVMTLASFAIFLLAWFLLDELEARRIWSYPREAGSAALAVYNWFIFAPLVYFCLWVGVPLWTRPETNGSGTH